MIAAKNESSLMRISDNKLVKLQKEMDQVIKTIGFIEQSFLLNEMSERIYNYYHGKYSKRKREIENQMDQCYLAMVKFEKFEYG